MVEANNLTDRSYERVEKIEHKKLLLTAIVIVCFVLAPIGIGYGTHSYMTTVHSKGDWSDLNAALIAIILVISSILIVTGIDKFNQVRVLKDKLSQMKLLEETIYNEVLKSNLHQLE